MFYAYAPFVLISNLQLNSFLDKSPARPKKAFGNIHHWGPEQKDNNERIATIYFLGGVLSVNVTLHSNPFGQCQLWTDLSLMSGFEMVTCSRISTILEIQLGKMLHSYKKSASNQGALYDSKKRDEIRKRLRASLSLVNICWQGFTRCLVLAPTDACVGIPVRCNWSLHEIIIPSSKTVERFQIDKIREYSKKRLHESPKPTPKPKVTTHRKKTFKKLKSLFLHFVKYHPDNK